MAPRTSLALILLTTSGFALPLRFERRGDSFVAAGAKVNCRGARFGPVRMRFRGVRTCAVQTESPARVNYITGRDAREWRLGVPSFAEVRFAGIYPGISVVYHANRHDLEFDFHVEPGADWRRIALDFPGSRTVRIDSNGDALVGGLRIRRPDVFQSGKRLPGRFMLAVHNRLRFEVTGADSRAPLVIDPVVVYATLAGGDDSDVANGIAIDSVGNAYVAGVTKSSNFPTRAPYAGARGGVSKSTNGAAQWASSSSGFASVQVQAIAIDPAGILYAATFAGVFKSANSGTSWTAASSGLPSYYVNTVAIDPMTPSIIYAGTLADTGGGIYKSTDSGATWALLNFAGMDVQSILVHPTIAGVVLAGVGSVVPGQSAGNLYRSVDGGVTWNVMLSVGAPATAIVADSQTPPLLYAGMGGISNSIFKSADAGVTWQKINSGTSIQAMAVDPKTPSTVFAVGLALLRSVDSGGTWQSVGPPCDVYRAVAIDSANTSNVYAACSLGVMKSADGGNTWAAASTGLNSVNVYALAIDPRTPSTIYAGQRTLNDAFVAKYDPSGNLIYATYLGGSNNDAAMGIAVDASGNAYVTGYTSSTDFPTTPGSLQTANAGANGTNDASVTKLSSTGTLVYSTYLGGSANEGANGIAVDSAGDATVTGYTASTNFPVDLAIETASKVSSGNTSVFVSRLNSSGSLLLYSTFLAGAGSDAGNAIALDAQGNAYVAGTASGSFPLQNPFQTTVTPGFVAKFDGSGRPLYSSYLGGGPTTESVAAIAVDGNGAAYVTGYDFSTSFPLVNPLYTTGRAFLSKVAPNGSALTYSTRLGALTAIGYGVAVDPTGNAYVTGIVSSTDLPLVDPLQITLHGSSDVFLMKFNPAGSALLYSTYFGGSGVDQASAIAVDAQGTSYIAGYMSQGASYPLTAGAAQTSYGGGASDAFIAKITSAPSLTPALSPAISRNGIINGGDGGELAVSIPGKPGQHLWCGFCVEQCQRVVDPTAAEPQWDQRAD